ncbi:hypothetical protein EC968_000020 [Mortierella alpina]|nr:hypothetical protein EC968_000020 [Mortierella alpina]
MTTGLSLCDDDDEDDDDDDLEGARVTLRGQLTLSLQEQQYRRRKYNSPAEALASGQLHDLDRQEIERWLEWKKRERIRRMRELKRRKQQLARRSRGRVTEGVHSKTHGDEEDGDWDSFDDHDYSDGSWDSESEVEYDTEDDETALMKVISGIDYLRTLLHPEHGNGPNPMTSHLSQPPAKGSTKALRLFSTVLERARQQQALKECRCRLARIQKSDGLPASLPLSTCGQWIQVINLQQETPFPQPTSPQSFMHPSPLTSHARQQRSHVQHPQQPPLDPEVAPLGFLTSFFAARAHNRGDPLSTLDSRREPARLRSRRDDISDQSLQTILNTCTGLCRLTLSECHGITDAGMRMIYDSACVAQGTLVSLHMAGCHQITDQGLFHLIGIHTNNSIRKDSSRQPRFESLDLAGCYGVTDKGLIPVLEQCGARLTQLRVSDCEGVTQRSVETLAQHCPAIQWLDVARTGTLTTECLLLLAERCSDLEWLNLARIHVGELQAEETATDAPEGAEPAPAAEARDSEHADLSDDNDGDEDHDADTDADAEAADDENDDNGKGTEMDVISDHAISVLCELCPKLQLLDLSYIPTVTNVAIEALSESAKSLVCLTIIGCPGITSQSLVHLAKLRRSSGKLGCITMGDALGISERDIEEIMQGTLSGWQKSLVDETNLGEILGRSWDE